VQGNTVLKFQPKDARVWQTHASEFSLELERISDSEFNVWDSTRTTLIGHVKVKRPGKTRETVGGITFESWADNFKGGIRTSLSMTDALNQVWFLTRGDERPDATED
jgi:hypothetical protein